MTELELMGEKAVAASRITAGLKINEKNNALLTIADYIVKESDYIIAENNKDIEAGIAADMKQGLLDQHTTTHMKPIS